MQESRERVRAAVRNSGFEFPTRRVTASLAPADLRQVGPAYDLPIAMESWAAAVTLGLIWGERLSLVSFRWRGAFTIPTARPPMVWWAR
jgi:hypothetical protein